MSFPGPQLKWTMYSVRSHIWMKPHGWKFPRGGAPHLKNGIPWSPLRLAAFLGPRGAGLPWKGQASWKERPRMINRIFLFMYLDGKQWMKSIRGVVYGAWARFQRLQAFLTRTMISKRTPWITLWTIHSLGPIYPYMWGPVHHTHTDKKWWITIWWWIGPIRNGLH